jgi:hypothetical protein
MEHKYNVAEIVSKFQIQGKYVSAELWGQGNINDTYLVLMDEIGISKKYIVQRVNHNVFKNVPRLMDNVVLVTEHIRAEIIASGGDPSRTVLNFIKTKDGNNYLIYEDNYFRAYYFIDDVLSYQVVSDHRSFYESAVAFGRFQKYLSTFPADVLYEVIPDFHNTRARYDKFMRALKENKAGRAVLVKKNVILLLPAKST